MRQILIAEALQMPGGAQAKKAIGALTVDHRSGQTTLSGKATLVADAILFVEGERTIQVHHTEELSALDLAKVTLAHGEGDTLKLVLRQLLQLQLGAIIGQATQRLHVIDDNRIGQQHGQLIGVLVAHISAN